MDFKYAGTKAWDGMLNGLGWVICNLIAESEGSGHLEIIE